MIQKYLLAFTLTVLHFSVQCQNSYADIWARGSWMLIGQSSKNNFVIDQNNIKVLGNSVYTYMSSIDIVTNRYAGPLEFTINCQAKTYTYGNSLVHQWNNINVASQSAKKLCGDTDRSSGDKYEYMGTTIEKQSKGLVDTYWVPNDVVRDLNNPNVFIVKTYIGTSPPPLDFNVSMGALAEIDCQNLKFRYSFGVVGKIDIDSSKDWATLVSGAMMHSRVCMNKDLEVKLQLPTRQQSTQKNSFSMTDAKSKCEDIGFKPDTEGFGKCVLQLTRY